MIEIPESNTLARQLEETIAGKKIKSVCAGKSPHKFAFFTADPAEYGALFEGKRVDRAQALSGQIQICAEEMRLVFNDGTNLRYFLPGEKLPDKHQLLMEFEDKSALTCTVQMYGGIHAFAEGENENEYYEIAKKKQEVSPLSEAFDKDYFFSLWDKAKPTISIKALLATEQRIPGLGNGTLQDILFCAGVNPKSRIFQLEPEKEKILKSLKATLIQMTEQGGRDTEKDLFGNPGGYKTVLSSKTWKEPCPVCGGEIERKAFLGGNVYYCPACQPIKK